MKYAYLRCSTSQDKQDISRQKRELLQSHKVDRWFGEYASGAKEDREELQNMLKMVVAGDIIVATEVSRLTRSTKQLCEIIELAKEKKIKLILGNFVVDCTSELDPMTAGMLKMMGVFSELEREITRSRIKSGMANKKAKGAIFGRKEVTKDNLPAVFVNNYPLWKDGKIKIAGFARLCNVTRPTIYKYVEIIERVN